MYADPAKVYPKNIRKKRISVSQKRQITIPIEFFKELSISDYVECILIDNAIVIRPLKENSGDFDVEILDDLISQGYSGKDLINKFKEMRSKIRPAVSNLLDEARLVAEGRAEYSTYKDIFDTE